MILSMFLYGRRSGDNNLATLGSNECVPVHIGDGTSLHIQRTVCSMSSISGWTIPMR